MEPNDWPADMRNHNLRDAARDAYWHLKDCERVAENPIGEIITAVALNGAAFLVAGWWAALAVPVLVVLCVRCHRRSVALRPAVEQAKARLEALKAQGVKVWL